MDFTIFGKKTSRRIHIIKIVQFRSIFMEKSCSKIKVEKSIAKREKTQKSLKIRITYYSKLKSKATRRKIMKKILNLS